MKTPLVRIHPYKKSKRKKNTGATMSAGKRCVQNDCKNNFSENPLVRFPCTGQCYVHRDCLEEILLKIQTKNEKTNGSSLFNCQHIEKTPIEGRTVHDILKNLHNLWCNPTGEIGDHFRSDFIFALNTFLDFLSDRPSWFSPKPLNNEIGITSSGKLIYFKLSTKILIPPFQKP